MHEAINDALRSGRGILRVGDWPGLAHHIRVARDRGELTAVLRGIYAHPGAATSFEVRVLALLMLDPDAILTGPSAAIALGWRTAQPDEVVEASTQRIQGSRPGFRLSRRCIDPDHVVERGEATESPDGTGMGGVRCTGEALTTLDLARESGANPIDDALRQGQTLNALWSTLEEAKGRRGNQVLRQHLVESRDEPWSAAERAGHLGLHAQAVTGWVANLRVKRPTGPVAFIDIAFESIALAIEIDGHAHHSDPISFEGDRLRDLDLWLTGWAVVRVSATWVLEDPKRFAQCVMQLATRRALELGVPFVV